MRRGCSSPRSISASAISDPWVETATQPSITGASRPRSSTGWPWVSRAASDRLTDSAGSSCSPASTRRKCAPAPAASALYSSAARATVSLSANGPTAVRRNAVTWPSVPSARPMSRAIART